MTLMCAAAVGNSCSKTQMEKQIQQGEYSKLQGAYLLRLTEFKLQNNKQYQGTRPGTGDLF